MNGIFCVLDVEYLVGLFADSNISTFILYANRIDCDFQEFMKIIPKNTRHLELGVFDPLDQKIIYKIDLSEFRKLEIFSFTPDYNSTIMLVPKLPPKLKFINIRGVTVPGIYHTYEGGCES